MTEDGIAAALSLESQDEMSSKLGLSWVEARAGRMVARIPVEGNTDSEGYLDGGASVTLAETLTSAGTWLINREMAVMGLEIKTNHLKRVNDGMVTGTATLLFSDSTRAVWEVRVIDAADDVVSITTCTIAIRQPRSFKR